MSRYYNWGLLLILVALAGCLPQTTVPSSEPLVVTATPSVSTPTVEPTVTAIPTEPLREFVTYRHPSGVFSISIPADWERVDLSSPRRLEVRLIPPPGFGSRILIDGRNEGALAPDQISGLIESAVQAYYWQNIAYTEVERTALEDGQMRIAYRFDDGTGAAGRETLYIYYVEPFFVTIRVFLSESDAPYLATALETMRASFAIDSQAAWGAQVAAINPAELLLTNTHLWRSRAGITYFMGELYNASPSNITDIKLSVAFCDAVGIIISETSGDIPPAVVKQGVSVPFSLEVEGLPDGVTACTTSVTATPAVADPVYTTNIALSISDVSYNQFRRDLRIEGEVTNPTLTPLHDIDILIAAYDSDNVIVGYIFFRLEIDERLDPGQTAPFEIVIPALAGQPDHYATLIQGYIFSLDSPSLVPTPTP